jgi:hypothetical protein
MNIDELGLVPVEKANSKKSVKTGPKGPKEERFDLRRSNTKSGVRFTFTRRAFDRLELENNSAKQFLQPTSVVVAVMPGNSGIFLRNTNKGAKGRAFKNDELSKALDERGITAGAFVFRQLGEKDGAKYYVLDPIDLKKKSETAVAETAAASVAE